MFPRLAIVPGQPPNDIACVAYWYDTTTVPPAQVSESFVLSPNAALPGWTGSSSGPGYALTVEVVQLPTPDHYDVNLKLTYAGGAVDDESWHDEVIPPYPYFSAGPLDHIYHWPADANGVQLAS